MCTLIVLVAATWIDPMVPALAVSTAWVAFVIGGQVRGVPDAITMPIVQLTSAAVALAAATVLHRRLTLLRMPDHGLPTR